MIRGRVTINRQAIVSLNVRGPGGVQIVVDALVDTGFNLSLTLPMQSIMGLGLTRTSGGKATTADGSQVMYEVYEAEVEWDGSWRPVLVSAIGNEVYLGMRLLLDHELRIAVVTGGDVEITPIP